MEIFPKTTLWGDLLWSQWIPLNSNLKTYQEEIPTLSGFYRIKSNSYEGLIYIGQTGRNLRERTRALATHTYRNHDSPPWNDPHTAASVLWAYKHENNFAYEVSVAVKENYDLSMRQTHEDFLLYLHRMKHGHSTLANHGRRHPLWTKPSNKSNGVSMERQEKESSFPSLSKPGKNKDFKAKDWLDLEWSESMNLADVQASSSPGVYRIFNNNVMLYCGETKDLKKRLNIHKRNSNFFHSKVSFIVMENSLPHQLKEREVDLIGAYFELRKTPPVHQYCNH